MMDIEVPDILPSQQDMELIDILWRQDVDLGARREVFDQNHRQKVHALQRRSEQEEEKKQQRLRDEQKALLDQLQLDEETGEYIPKPLASGALTPPPPATANPLAVIQNVNFPEGDDSMSFDECMQLLAETFPLAEDTSACLDSTVPPVPSSDTHSLMPSKQPAPPLASLSPAPVIADRRGPEMDQAWMELWSLPELQHCLNLQMEDPLETTAYLPTRIPDVQEGTYTYYPLSNAPNVGPNPVEACPPTFINAFEEVFHDMVAPEPMMGDANLGPKGFCGDAFYPDPVLCPPEAVEANVMEHKESSILPELPKKPPLNAVDAHSHSPLGEALERCKQEPMAEVPDSDSGISLNPSPHASSPEKSVYGDGSFGFSDSDMDDLDYNPGSAESDYSEMFSLNFQPDDFQQSALMLSQAGQPEPQQDKKPKLHNAKPMEEGGQSEGPFTKDKQKRRSEVRLSRDEQRARALRIPFTVDMIINLPVDDFNELMSKHQLNEPQLALVRDIRRRGKNKVAAQNCRKRKMENIVGLEYELDSLTEEKELLQMERSQNGSSLRKMKHQLSTLYLQVFSMLRDEEGKPYSPSDYSLQQTTDGSVFLVPRTKKTHAKSKNHKPASAD
ncbi:nuclear factor erythroid 2-related factor 2a [Gadus macrocephalus]|uniref:nuclear factor erythroid 2-related factor 2a n=1 Tax=Gadus macrocephalus TaxID=80720 RepID=UPI0028CBAF44|nr:nuclear factor erythroid 2-related factor 2a [Gadus macrocephalus]